MGETITAAFDFWHFRSIVSGVTELIDFAEWLATERNYDIYPIRFSYTKDDLEGVDILFILSPGYKFTQSEIEAIHEWVKAGGILTVSRPIGKMEIINPLIQEFGARFTGETVDSWAFYADIPPELEELGEQYRILKNFLSKHPVNTGLKAVAEGSPKDKKHPYVIEIDISKEKWSIIGAATKNGEPKITAAIKQHYRGLVTIIGCVYLFYKWRFWLRNRELEEEENSYLTNFKFINNLLNYFEENIRKGKRIEH